MLYLLYKLYIKKKYAENERVFLAVFNWKIVDMVYYWEYNETDIQGVSVTFFAKKNCV